jgi:hypothetical protein
MLSPDDLVRVSLKGEYEDGFYIEALHDWNHGRCWAVPAWDEWGMPEFVGPFASFAEAYAVFQKTPLRVSRG